MEAPEPKVGEDAEEPRDTPTRTGVGVAGMTFYAALWVAGSADLIATQFQVSFEGVIRLLRGIAVLGPAIAFIVTRQVCLAFRAHDREVGEDEGTLDQGRVHALHPVVRGRVAGAPVVIAADQHDL